MIRTAVNPWDWSAKFGYTQGEVIEAATRQLICAGQTAVDGQGSPMHPGDMRGQMGRALDNLEQVLAGAGMGLGDVIRMVIYCTDVDQTLRNFDVVAQRMGAARCEPPMTPLGVARLANSALMIEIEATSAT